MELYPADSIYLMDDASAESIVAAIRILRDSDLRSSYEKRISKTYEGLASQKVLNKDFDDLIQQFQLK
jgi:hypothetical protein